MKENDDKQAHIDLSWKCQKQTKLLFNKVIYIYETDMKRHRHNEEVSK